MKTYLILIALFCCISCQITDHAYDSSSLSLEEASKLKEKFYSDHIKDLLLNRSKEMNDQVITINNRQIKFDLSFRQETKDGWVYLYLFMERH